MAEKLNPLTFPLHGTRLIEASAGTGKTYTIAALYLRLVLGHGGKNGFVRELTPPEILVVTFTNAATQELRERIRSRLTAAGDYFREKGEGDEFLENLRADYDPDLWLSKARLLDQAAQWMDESAIHTIHGWCQRMLRQHAFDSLSLFDLELKPSDHDLYEEAARDFWRAGFYSQPMEIVSEFISAVAIKTPQELLKQAMPLINAGQKPGQKIFADPIEMLHRRRQSIEETRMIWKASFKEAVDLVVKAQADKSLNNNKYRKASLDNWILQLDSWVNSNGFLPDSQVLEKFSAKGLSDGVSNKKTFPVHPAYDALDRMNGILGSLDVKKALLSHAAEEINSRVVAAKARLSRMGFNDLLTRLGEALSRKDSRLGDIIRRQFPVALIDEFQDTDPVQYSSFGSVYLGHEDAGLFMIGDPKQAIYGFRGADIHTYLGARKDTFGRHYTLDRNYRSTVGVVNAVNQMFHRASGFPDGPFLFKDSIPFEPLLAQGRSDLFMVDGVEALPVTLWQMEQDGPVVKNGSNGYISTMAEAGAGEMVRLLNLGAENRAGFKDKDGTFTPLCSSDMAVLVRDGREASAIRAALERKGVRSVYLSDRESVFESHEARSLFYLIRACFDPLNERVVRTALATTILDLPLKTLDRLNNDELAWEFEVERFKMFQKIWQNQGVLPMVRAILTEFNVKSRLLSTSTGERQLTNLLHLAEMLQTQGAVLDNGQGLIRWFSDQIEHPEAGVEDEILRLESDGELVKVVTIHKSKGLEYPLVFLPFVCSFRKINLRNTSMVKLHDSMGHLQMVVNPGENELCLADRERLAEDIRMLYVALTRSCFATFLGVGVMGKSSTKSGETTSFHESGFGYLVSGGDMINTADLPLILNEFKGNCDAIGIKPLPEPSSIGFKPESKKDELSEALVFKGTIPRNWWITSYSGILIGAVMPEQGELFLNSSQEIGNSPDTASQDQLQETETQVTLALVGVRSDARSIHTFPRGPEPGTFLHDILEWAANHGFDRVAADRGATLNRVTQVCKRREWDEWSEVLTDWLMDLLRVELILPDTTMVLSDISSKVCRAEMEFMFAAHDVDVSVLDRLVFESVLPGKVRPILRNNLVNGMVKGFIDLIFCFKGRYFVMDYKSNYLGETEACYGKEAMAEAMLEHRYDLQYVLYTLALHRFLGARLVDYDYGRDVGGVVYLFLRAVNGEGAGTYVDKPSLGLITKLDKLFQKGDVHDF